MSKSQKTLDCFSGFSQKKRPAQDSDTELSSSTARSPSPVNNNGKNFQDLGGANQFLVILEAFFEKKLIFWI